MKIDQILAEKREEILEMATRHGAGNVRVFGSVVHGNAGPQSDVDLLVEMTPGRSLLDLIGFWQDVEELLGRRVDVITDGGISPYLKDRIYSEAVLL